jgi:predicted Rossmann fold flavoprotein
MRSVIVIGGGAAGMMAALTAAEDKNNRVTLLERQQRVGRKLLATGNGRCNLSNRNARCGNYHGEQPDFVRPALRQLPPDEALALFRSFGLLTVTEPSGRVYPLSDSASSVLDVLRFQLAQRGVELRCAAPAREIRREKGGFRIVTDE